MHYLPGKGHTAASLPSGSRERAKPEKEKEKQVKASCMPLARSPRTAISSIYQIFSFFNHKISMYAY